MYCYQINYLSTLRLVRCLWGHLGARDIASIVTSLPGWWKGQRDQDLEEALGEVLVSSFYPGFLVQY